MFHSVQLLWEYIIHSQMKLKKEGEIEKETDTNFMSNFHLELYFYLNSKTWLRLS